MQTTAVPFLAWFLVAGVLLTVVALSITFRRRLPLSSGLIYLLTGIAIGPLGLALVVVDPLSERGAPAIERLAEIAVIVSLFSAGLKFRKPITDPLWLLPLRLAGVSMIATIALIALAGYFLIGLPWGGAILLGAVLAPTDPVLASDVSLENARDDDRMRFALTGEAGLNDGAAFPFVMLGLGLLGMHELGAFGWRWVTVDLLWAIPGGLAVGALLGYSTGRFVLLLRRRYGEGAAQEDFLALGLLSTSYGIALLLQTWAFLAVFAAGVALRAAEHGKQRRDAIEDANDADPPEGASDRGGDSGVSATVLAFSEQAERMLEVVMVVMVGALLVTAGWSWHSLWFVPLVLFVVRPIAVALGLLGARVESHQRWLIGWFGIRGIGTIYYLMHAENLGLPDGVARPVLVLVLATIATSVVLHGVSVSPLMRRYERR